MPEAPAADDLDLEVARQELIRRRLSEVEDGAVIELASIQAELERRRFLADPVYWAQRRLGDTLWSSQCRIIESVRDNRRTAVISCHEIGKSFIAALAAGWWLDTNPPGTAFVVTSAPSGPQVKTILWREIGRVHARGQLRGRVNQTEWYMRMPAGNEEQVAIGRKPDEYDPTAFQGIHAPRVLVIFDEANGIRGPLHEAADSLIANDFGKFLMISNPDDPSGEFFEACKPGSGWAVHSISAFDSPNFTGEELPERIKQQLIGRVYVEEKRKKWAPHWTWTPDGSRCVPPADSGESTSTTNPYWTSKILGQFPENSTDGGLLPVSWVKAAQLRQLTVTAETATGELGLDVGGGGDTSVGCVNRGGICRILWEDRNPDTMATCGRMLGYLDGPTNANIRLAKVDEIGIGRGVVNRAHELKKPVFGVNVGAKARDPKHFVNLRAELWWHVRTLFEQALIDIDPGDEDLASELLSIRFTRISGGKIQIESKKEAKARGVPSPNRADALMLACAPLAMIGSQEVQVREAVWG
jgi:hypothetical protein